ncbi:MAG: MBL fold metallo-hydrolase [Planctomycetota bacterium]|nr:MAG: MBL fold metallo-hydrolase [Planctomycetota bacterium]
MRIELGGGTVVEVLRDGVFRLDGGAMFGVVPKPLWSRRKPSDERNRIRLGLNCLLVRAGGRMALADTGIGQGWSDKLRDIYGIEREPGLETELRRRGLDPEELELVVLTHLHFDHAGGNTRPLEDGTLVPSFPRARYVVQHGNLYEEALAPNELRRASYLPRTFMPVLEAGLFAPVRGDAELWPGLEVVLTRGHALWHQSILVRGAERTLFYPGDLVPTAAHLDPPYIMAYDHLPLETLANKKRWLGQAAAERWLIVLEHEDTAPLGRVVRDGERFRWEPLEPGEVSG